MSADFRLGAFGQVARRVTDIAVAAAWYRDVLGLRHLYTFGKLSFFDCGGVRLFLQEGEGPLENSLLYFKVPDIGAATAALKARGVRFIHEPALVHRHEDGTEEWMAFFNDPDARPLALMSQLTP